MIRALLFTAVGFALAILVRPPYDPLSQDPATIKDDPARPTLGVDGAGTTPVVVELNEPGLPPPPSGPPRRVDSAGVKRQVIHRALKELERNPPPVEPREYDPEAMQAFGDRLRARLAEQGEAP